MFADLLQRSLDAEFDDEFGSSGYFKKAKRGGKYYWYFRSDGATKSERYVGPVTDKSITDRVNRFKELKSDYRDRQRIVRALVAAGFVAADKMTGRVVEAMWQAGFFRLRGVLVGTIAFQTYGGLLGIDLRGRALQTQDADFAQLWGISQNIDDSMPKIIEVIRDVDETFKPVTNLKDEFASARYRNASGYYVDMLTPNRGSDEHQGKFSRMKALSGSPAQPLRHLDYLIHEPERSVLLHGGGVPVTVPRPERYAIHKLIVAVSRADKAKAPKDAMQADVLIEALATLRRGDLAEAFIDAWQVGPRWREHLENGLDRITDEARDALRATLRSFVNRKSSYRKLSDLAEPLPLLNDEAA